MAEVAWSRPSGRQPEEMRSVRITRNYTMHAEGSVLIEVGNTKVICTASVEEKVPGWLKDANQGWITAEYGMLPRSTGTRVEREAVRGKQSGRTQEIQRLIGRSLRSVVNLKALGPRTIKIDCDVIQADGGTRCASITGAFVALRDALNKLIEKNLVEKTVILSNVAAISVGIYKGHPVCDVDYAEDHECDTDMNVVMTGQGRFVEIQGTAEGVPFSEVELNQLITMAKSGIKNLIEIQNNL